MKRLRLGVVGLTHPHTTAWMQTFKLVPDVEIVALYDPDEQALAAHKQSAGGMSQLFSDLDDMLRQARLDIAMVLLPNRDAPAAAIKAIRAGSHVMVEKPCARNAAEFAPVLKAAKAARVKLSVGYCWPHHPIPKDIRAFIETGRLGKPYSIEARMVTTQVFVRGPKHWLFNRTAAGGGILSWLGCHWLDLMHYFLQSEVAEVSALTAEVGSNGIDVEDAASLSLRFKNGVIGSLHAGYYLARAGEAKELFMGVRGSLGAVNWAPGELTLKLSSATPEWIGAPDRSLSYVLPERPGYCGQMGLDHVNDFIAAIRSGREPLVTGQNALRVLRILDAAYASARTGRVVRL